MSLFLLKAILGDVSDQHSSALGEGMRSPKGTAIINERIPPSDRLRSKSAINQRRSLFGMDRLRSALAGKRLRSSLAIGWIRVRLGSLRLSGVEVPHPASRQSFRYEAPPSRMVGGTRQPRHVINAPTLPSISYPAHPPNE